mmetsp:Transcript_80451/g.227880  ORF Transcript_80451/g.227880 Transcript_80451/m.227880 type:complete len:245 (-) Transcript_80451:4-738(-)
MDAAAAARVDRLGVGFFVHEELHDGSAVSADGVPKARNALGVLGLDVRAGRAQVVLHRLLVAHLARLLDCHGALVDFLQAGLHLFRQPPHRPAQLQHEGLVAVVGHGSLRPAPLDVLEDVREVGAPLEARQPRRDRLVPGPELRAVVLVQRIGLVPVTQCLRVLREGLHPPRLLGGVLHPPLRLLPRGAVHPRRPGHHQSCAITEAQRLFVNLCREISRRESHCARSLPPSRFPTPLYRSCQKA